MKKLANLKGVKTLNKNEQKSINGGLRCFISDDCPNFFFCRNYICIAEPI